MLNDNAFLYSLKTRDSIENLLLELVLSKEIYAFEFSKLCQTNFLKTIFQKSESGKVHIEKKSKL